MPFLLFALWLAITPASLWAAESHGLSIDGNLKYKSDFKQFDYASDQARVGGTITLHAVGSFDKMNPFTLKGFAPDYLDTLVFETLTFPSLDEPFAQYGLLAETIDVAEDGQSVTFTLRQEARFADGSPVTTEDVAFSFNTLKSDLAHPRYQTYWRDIVKAEILDPRRIRFHFGQKSRELPLITGELPVFSKAFFQAHPFDKPDMTPPLGSGPYLVEAVDPGKTITYRRNPAYWGWHIGVRKGQFNFERVVLKMFMDDVVAHEAFKAGEYDFVHEYNSKQWARDYVGPAFDSGKIRKEELPHKNPSGMQGFVFNERRAIFQDIRVRQAFELAFDFEWSNKNLFHGQYARSTSYFTNSDMAATGTPSPAELALLNPLRDKLSSAVFASAVMPPTTDPPGSIRDNLLSAKKLLEEAGWKLGKDMILVNGQGQRLTAELLLASAAFERIAAPYAANLKKLGIELTYRTIDPSLYQQRAHAFDFDLLVHTFGQSLSPGNEQRDFWHSQSAEVKGSKNYIGLKDPAVDALVEKVIYATDRESLVTSCRALDRVLRAGHHLVPNWHIPYHRVAYWNKFKRPATTPLYYQPEAWLMTWWME